MSFLKKLISASQILAFLCDLSFSKIDSVKLTSACPSKSCIECSGTNNFMWCSKCKFLVTDTENRRCGIPITEAANHYGFDKSLSANCEGLCIETYSARCFLCKKGYILTTEGICKKHQNGECLLQ